MAREQLDRYVILGTLGRGGMGQVLRARDTRLGREVALKLLSREAAAQPECVERFLREARALAALDHPNIVTVHSVEEVDGQHFLTMALVEGSSLDRHIPERGMDAERWLSIARSIAAGLAAVHEKGVIHRDLKPANIMVTSEGRVKLVDFGLAKATSHAGLESEALELTQEGTAVGTIPYMSPEQLRGRSVDERSDIFSLGIVLYEMATGRHPFTAGHSAQVIAAILQEDPEPPSGPCLELPLPVAELIGRCLAKEADRRPRDLREILDCLTLRAVPETSTATRPPGDAAEFTPGTGACFSLPTRPSLAILPFQNLSGDPEQDHIALGLWYDLNAELIKLWGLFLFNGWSAHAYADRPVDPKRIGADLGVGHVLQGAVQRSGDRVRLTVQLFETAQGRLIWAEHFDRGLEDLFALQDEVNQRILEELGVQLLYGEQSRNNRLHSPAARERYFRAIPLAFGSTRGEHERARELLREALKDEPGSGHINSLIGWAHCLEAVYDYSDDPAHTLAEAERLAEEVIEQGDPDGLSHALKATLLLLRREHDAALEAARMSLTRRPGCPWVYAILGNIHNYIGEPRRAIELAAKAFRLSPFVPHLFPAVMAAGYYHARQPTEAVAAARRALEFDAQSLEALVILSASLAAAGRQEEARTVATSLRSVRPDFSLDWFADHEPYRDPEDLKVLLADLRQSGL